MRPTLFALGGGLIALLLFGGLAVVARRAVRPAEPAREVTVARREGPAPLPQVAAPTKIERVPPAPPPPSGAQTLVDQLTALLGATGRLSLTDQEALGALETRLLALGEAAAPALVSRLDAGGPSAVRERLFHVLRRLPGAAAEQRLVEEARGGSDAMRTMAIESLGERKSAAGVETLATVVRTDGALPAQALAGPARDPSNTSTELPDVQIYTPRMQAMAALASTHDPRATEVLAEVVRSGPDESLRMQAAVNLESLRQDRRALDALSSAATTDPSAFVRLAALHALEGAGDPTLAPALARIAAQDRDAGVRTLAQRVLAGLSR